MAGGHLTDSPSFMKRVVSQESVRIALLVAALDYLVKLPGSIYNAYLNADIKESILL